MILAAIIAVAVIAVVICELIGNTDPHSTFMFALLDWVVSDESPIDVPDSAEKARALVSHRVA